MPETLLNHDDSARLQEQVQIALANGTPLSIQGGNSKAFLGRPVDAPELDTRKHTGVVQYDPTELVITVRAGTPLHQLNATLAAQGQHLPPEAPDFNGRATVGGMVASALAGPRRPWVGSVRDYVLGCRVINGKGQHLRFGGQVMKNVAGYDVSRLMAGSLGCLGLITEVSLKVLPLPRASHSLALELDAESALNLLTRCRRDDLPVRGAFYHDRYLYIRLEGGDATVAAARSRLGGDETPPDLWQQLREQRLGFFDSKLPLWRVSVPWQTPLTPLPGSTLIDWAGAQRWLLSNAPAHQIRTIAASMGGHATCHTPGVDDSPFQPLPTVLMRIHQRLKAQTDPGNVFNPGRMYAQL